MGEAISCYPLDSGWSGFSETASSVSLSRRSSTSQSKASSCSSSASFLEIPDGGLKPPDRVRRQERIPRPLDDTWRPAINPHTSPIIVDSTSLWSPSAAAYKKISEDILELIAEHLSSLDIEEEYQATLTDLCNLSLVNSKWHKIAKRQLYRVIYMPAAELRPATRRFLTRPKSRLKLLQRTLQEQPHLCDYVREARVIGQLPDYTISQKDTRNCTSRLASIVSGCSFFERLSGCQWVFRHNQDPLLQALATRQRLREHKWILGPQERTLRGRTSFSYLSKFRSSPEQDQKLSLVRFHRNSKNLQSLSIKCISGGILHEDFGDIFKHSHMPALQRLELSNLSAADFGAKHLQFLPTSIQVLRLESLPGLPETELIRYLGNHLSLDDRQHLRELDLIDLDVKHISSIATILNHLYNLTRLTLITAKLGFDSSAKADEILHPFLSSKSLCHLHWEHGESSVFKTAEEGGEQEATLIDKNLAESILADGFPKLQRICAPADTHGIIQAVCRPLSSPVVQAAARSGSLRTNASLFASNDYHVKNSYTPLVHFVTSNNMPNESDLHLTDDNESKASKQASSAYQRAADALQRPRRLGRDLELGFKYSLLEEADPFLTLYINDEYGKTTAVCEFPQFVGRLGRGVPKYELLDDHTSPRSF